MCGNRVFVHESMYEERSQAELAVKLVKRVNQLKMGLPHEEVAEPGSSIDEGLERAPLNSCHTSIGDVGAHRGCNHARSDG